MLPILLTFARYLSDLSSVPIWQIMGWLAAYMFYLACQFVCPANPQLAAIWLNMIVGNPTFSASCLRWLTSLFMALACRCTGCSCQILSSRHSQSHSWSLRDLLDKIWIRVVFSIPSLCQVRLSLGWNWSLSVVWLSFNVLDVSASCVPQLGPKDCNFLKRLFYVDRSSWPLCFYPWRWIICCKGATLAGDWLVDILCSACALHHSH
jgi:hypothetical protein